MKNTIKILLVAAIAFASCSKPKDGATGPAGPTGNANVQTNTFTITSGLWTLSSTFWYANYTTTINDKAAVMAYWQTAPSEFVALPVTVNDLEVYFKTTPNYVSICVRSASGTNTVANPGDLTVKIVIIPPALKKQNVNYANYSEVKQVYGFD